MHAASRAALQVKLEGMTGQTVGIFASHFPARPTSIGISVVELTGIDGCSVKVKGFDAWNGTPVLDIKPYDYYDIVKLPKVPKWFKEFWRERKRKGRYAEKVPWLGP
jgi:tRNA (Thr-GGU) A37 N-methylase